MNRRLYRSRRDSVLGGVAGGVADYLDLDPSIVRVIWAVLAVVTGGLFLLIYIVMWIVVPEGPPAGFAAAPPPAAPPAPGTPPAEGTTGGPEPDAAAEPAAGEPAWGWQPPRHRAGSSNGALIFGLILIGLGAWFLIDDFLPDFDKRFVWPVALVVVGLFLLVIAMRRPRPE